MGCNHYVLRVIAIVMVITALCSLTCVNAQGEVITPTGDILIDIIWQTLSSWGIRILEDGASELTENVRYWLDGKIDEYLINERNELFESWIRTWQFTENEYGNLIGNNAYVEAVNEFAEHLISAFNLSDNSTIELQAGEFTWGGYKFNAGTYRWNGKLASGGIAVDAEAYAISSGAPFVMCKPNSNPSTAAYQPLFVWRLPFTIYSYSKRGTVIQYDGTREATLDTATGLYYVMAQGGYFSSSTNKPSYAVYGDTVREVLNNIGSNEIVDKVGIDAYNSNIITPENDLNYQEGYSIIYYSDGSIAYIDIKWPESIAVNNLPAIIAQNSIQNPGITSIWHYVSDTIDYFDDGVNLMRGVIYSVVPSPYLLLAYAALVLLLVFGLIKVARK